MHVTIVVNIFLLIDVNKSLICDELSHSLVTLANRGYVTIGPHGTLSVVSFSRKLNVHAVWDIRSQ